MTISTEIQSDSAARNILHRFCFFSRNLLLYFELYSLNLTAGLWPLFGITSDILLTVRCMYCIHCTESNTLRLVVSFDSCDAAKQPTSKLDVCRRFNRKSEVNRCTARAYFFRVGSLLVNALFRSAVRNLSTLTDEQSVRYKRRPCRAAVALDRVLLAVARHVGVWHALH